VILDQKEQCSIFETEAKCEISWESENEERSAERSVAELLKAGGKSNSLEIPTKPKNTKSNLFLRIKKFNDVKVV
jgi:hypothetical protein